MRKEHIDTMPVWDAYRMDVECPLCELKKKAETSNVDYFLGESVMEPDQRIEVNNKGFCPRHFKQLYDAGNRLGLGLMADTHTKEVLRKLKDCEAALTNGSSGESKRRFGFLPKKMDVSQVAETLKAMTESCVVCERMEKSMERYIYTVLYMYKHEKDFPELFRASKGVCLTHYYELVVGAGKELSGDDQASFLGDLARLESENFDRIEKEVNWFTQKFDYKNEDKPWGNSRDAVKRSVNKLREKVIE
ncbi:MAG: ABC transporter substrate-binding protein [Clostridiales bacterium]|nr:ABC transporter substrate-binding protein [Clostridiales bacterium]